MRHLPFARSAAFVVSFALLGCGGQRASSSTSASTSSGSGSGSGSTSTSTGTGGAGTGGASAGTGGAGTGGGSAVCTPMPGTGTIQASCDQIQIAVLAHQGSAAKLALRGRLLGAQGACFRIDSVDLVAADTSLVQHLPASGVAVHSDDIAPWVTGDAVAAVTKPCATDTPRVEVFSVIVKGAVDGGTFKASCGSIEGGSSWPPRVLLTCHDGLDEAPVLSGNGMVDVNTQFGLASTNVSAYLPASNGVTAVDTSVHVIPEVWMGPPIQPFDTMGWMTSINSDMDQTHVTLISDKDLLGKTLCPVPPQMPMQPPPDFLARITGKTSKGPFSSEIWVPICTRLVM